MDLLYNKCNLSLNKLNMDEHITDFDLAIDPENVWQVPVEIKFMKRIPFIISLLP